MGRIGETLGVRVKLSGLTRPKISPAPVLANRTPLVRVQSSGLRSDSPRTRWPRGRMGAGFLTCHSPRHCRRLKFLSEKGKDSKTLGARVFRRPRKGSKRPRTRQESPKCNSRAGFLWLRGSTVRTSWPAYHPLTCCSQKEPCSL